MCTPSVAGLLWLAAAFVPMIVSQLLRLHQTDPVAWLFWDYAGRIGALAALAAIPSARAVAFRREKLRASRWEPAFKIVVGLVLADFLLRGWFIRSVTAAVPGTVLGTYPILHGALFAFDLAVGLALVAYHEEIVFRRLARRAVQPWVGDGHAMVAVTSLLFAAYHWWTGLGNICSVVLLGTLLMLAYLHLRALWPIVLAHYLIGVTLFA